MVRELLRAGADVHAKDDSARLGGGIEQER
jgi:hypothetical protein